MRKIVWFTIGTATACFAAIYKLWNEDFTALLYAAAVMTALLLFSGFFIESLKIPAIFFSGFSAGLVWFFIFQTCYLNPACCLDGQTVYLKAEATSFSEESTYSFSVDGKIKYGSFSYKVRFYITDDLDIRPGDNLEGNFRVRLTAPGGKKESPYYQGNGIFLVASQKGELTVTSCDRVTAQSFPAYLAKAVTRRIEKCFPEDTMLFAKALLLGDTSDLSYKTDSDLKTSGIRHVVAVSGLHVTILYGLIVFILGQRRKIASLAAIIILAIFASAAGFTPSVTRACIMTALMSLSMTLDREYDPPAALAFACLVMIGVNPFIVTSVSMQLSVASVAGILMFTPSIQSYLGSLFSKRKWHKFVKSFLYSICASVSVTVGAMTFTAPLSAYYFGIVSLIGIVTNVFTLWCISFIFCGTAITCLIDPVFPWISGILSWLISWIIRYVLFVAAAFASFPFAAVYTESAYIIAWIVICYLLLAVFLVSHKKHPFILTAISAACLIAAVICSCVFPRIDNCRMNVIYVGEGQSILLQSKGETLLIDCGGSDDVFSANAVVRTLRSMGIYELDGIAVTHYDRDHTGGIPNLLTQVDVKNMILPQMDDKNFLASIPEYPSEKIQIISDNVTYSFGCGQITLFKPGSYKTENENCMCILFESENCDILITGDRGKQGEKQLIRNNMLPDVDVLIAGHHGSKNSTSQELLDAVKPEVVIVSCGAGNSYGHPAQELLERLDENHCTVYRTDLQGSVMIRR